MRFEVNCAKSYHRVISDGLHYHTDVEVSLNFESFIFFSFFLSFFFFCACAADCSQHGGKACKDCIEVSGVSFFFLFFP